MIYHCCECVIAFWSPGSCVDDVGWASLEFATSADSFCWGLNIFNFPTMIILVTTHLRQLLLSRSILNCEGQAHDVAGLAGLIRGAADHYDDDGGDDGDDGDDGENGENGIDKHTLWF